MKIFYFLSFLFLSSLYFTDLALSKCSPYSPCCCQEYPGGEEKCFTQGFCCGSGYEQFWDPVSCFKFDFWVEPKSSMFTVGKKTSIILYIRNTGAYADNYNITYNITKGNPSLIQVDMSGVSPVENVDKGEIRKVYPTITVLATIVSGEIFFNATSLTDLNITRNATLTILPSDFPVSLPEFNFLGLICIMIFTTIILMKKSLT